jgi:F-type H+-transporting ATPase subunit b
MPRQPIAGLGLLVVALALCLSVRPVAAAETPAETKGHIEAGRTEAHAPGGGGENPIEPQASLALWTVVVFLGLLAILGRFAWKPLLTSLHNREEHLEHVLHETERARNESEQLLNDHRRQLAAAHDQIRALIDEAKKNAQLQGDEIVKRAQDEAESQKHRAERDIANAKDQALSEIWSHTANLAVDVAGKVIGKSLGDEDHRRLVESAIAALPASPNGTGGRSA